MNGETSSKNSANKRDDGGPEKDTSVEWGLVLTGMIASCSAVILIMFGSETDLNDAFTTLGTFVLMWSMFSTGVSAQIKRIVETGDLKESIWISMLSTPLGIAAALLVYLVALVVLGDSLLVDNLSFWDRLFWAAPILVSSGLAYIAPSYLMAWYEKRIVA